jgi:hypothetical protein
MNTEVLGKISRLVGGIQGGNAACWFRLGTIACQAQGALAENIVLHRGWPGHQLQITGFWVKSKLHRSWLAVETVKVVD